MNRCVEPSPAQTADQKPTVTAHTCPPGLTLRAPGLSPRETTVTSALISDMARHLGLQLNNLTIAIDESAGRSLRVHGAHGRTQRNLIELDPLHFKPGRFDDRALLAHELTHAAQTYNQAPVAPSLRLAEEEARENADAARLGRTLNVPLHRLQGVAFEVPQTTPATTAVTSLATLVARNYRRERERIRVLLDGIIVTNGEVEQVLRILEPMAFETASALIESLDSQDRLRLVDEINTPHYARFRSQIIATIAALSENELGQQDKSLLESVRFDALTTTELLALQRAFTYLPADARTALSEGDRAAEFHSLRNSPPGSYDREEAEQTLALQEEQRAVSVTLANANVRSQVYRLSQRLQALLLDADADKARSALRLIAGLDILATPPPQPQEQEQPASPPDGLTMAALRIIASDLDEQGAIDRLIDELPEPDRNHGPLRDAFRQLMSARAPWRNLQLVEELLDPGWWFFGRVDREEAMLAYDIVMTMPLVDRERLIHLERGGLLRRMLNALPDELVQSPDFALPEVARTADGQVVEASHLYAPGGLRDSESELVGRTLEMFRDPAGDADTGSRLAHLLEIARLQEPDAGDALSPRHDAVLSSVVRRLDAEGLLEPFLSRLSPDQLASRDTAPYLAMVFEARDPVFARAYILQLLNHRKFLLFSLDSVEPREAFLAFHLMLALPAADREAIETADGGKPWGRMLENLSNRTLAEAGFGFFRAELHRDGTNAVRSRLDDDQLWNGDHNDQLISIIELARATGEFDYVFETSRLRMEAGLSVPATVSARYQLYDPGAGRTTPTPVTADIEVPGGSLLRLLFGSRWSERDVRYVYGEPVDILGSDYRDASVSSMRATIDLEQLQALRPGHRLGSIAEVARSGEARAPVTPENRDALMQTSNVVDIMLQLEQGRGVIQASQIRLDNTHYISSGSMIRTGAVTLSGLNLQIGFERGDLVKLTSVAAELGRLEVETPVYSTDDSAIAARRATLTTLHAAIGDFSQQQPEQPLVGHLFGLILTALWRTFVSQKQILEDPLAQASLFDHVDLSFASLTIDELHTSGGQRIGQTTVTEARIAAATNRAAYQRLLVESLTRRLERETSQDTRERLQQRLTAASAEATRLEPLEREYRDLVRRMGRQDGRLSEDESQRLAELQEDEDLAVGGRMGAIVDIGQIRVAGIDGSVSADDIELNGLHGEGEFRDLFGFTVEELTTEQQINRFVQFGPEALQTHPEGEQPSDTSFALEIPSVAISGLVVQGEIPSARSVQLALLELPASPPFARERARMQSLVTRLTVYEYLRRQPEPEAPTDRIAHRRQLMEERRALAGLFGSSITKLDARHITLGAQPTHQGRLAQSEDEVEDPDRSPYRARGNIGIGSLDMRGVRHGAIHAEHIHGEQLHGSVQLRTPGLDAYASPDGQFEVALFGGDSLIINNPRMGDGPNRADRIQIDGFEGTARLNHESLSVEGFMIDKLTTDDAHFQTATSYFWSQGVSILRGIRLNFRIPFDSATNSSSQAAGPALSRLDTSILHIDRLHIDEVSADQLGYRGYDNTGGFSKEVIVESGIIGDIDVTNFNLRMPQDQDMGYDGGVTIRTLDAVQFSSRFGESLRVRGQLDSGERSEAEPAISINIASAEELYVELDNLDLTQGTVDLRTGSGHGRVLVRQAQFSGEVAMVGNEIRVRHFVAPLINISSVHWTASTGTEVTAENARLHDFRLNLDYITEDEDHTTVALNELYIGRFAADSIIYADSPGMHVALNPRTDPESASAELLPMIQGLRLKDLSLRMGPDSFSMSGGHGRIENADIVASALSQAETGSGSDRYQAVTGLFANISAGGISFSDLGYGDEGLTIMGGIERLGADGSFDLMPAEPGAPAGSTRASGDYSISQGRIGSFRYGNGLIQIGPDNSEGLVIDEIQLQSLRFNSGDYELLPVATETAMGAPAGSTGSNLAPSSVTAHGLRLNMDLYLHKDSEDAPDTATAGSPETEQSAIDRIDIHQLHFDSIALQGYRLFLREKGIFIDIPAGLDSSIQDINLHGPLPDQPFSIRLDTPTPTLLGSISTGALLAQQIGVQMGNNLRARLDFEAESSDIGFLETIDPDNDEQGPIRIDLTNWSATNILAYIGEGTSTRLRAGRMLGDGGIGGAGLGIELGEDGSTGVNLRGLWARGFELRDQDLGAALTLGRISMPDENEIEYVNGPSDTTPGNTHTRIRINHLDVDTANFVVTDLSHMIHQLGGPDIQHELTTTDRAPDPDAQPDTDPALLDRSVLSWIRNHQALFDSLQGHISADVQFPLGSVTGDYGTLHPEIDLQIENGGLDIDQMEDQLSSIDELAGTTFGAANLKFDPNTSTPTLVFGIGGHLPVQPTDPGGIPVGDPIEIDLHRNLYEWRMAEDEMLVIRSSRRVGINRLLQVDQGNFDPAAEPEQPDPDAIPQSVAQQFRGLRVNDFSLQLRTDNTDALPISLGDYGSLELAPQALQDLRIQGNLQPYNFDLLPGNQRQHEVFRSMHRDSTGRPGNFGLSFDQLALQELDINIPAFGDYAGGGIEGDVSIEGVRGVSLDFRGLVPHWLSGQVGAVKLRNIEINLEELTSSGLEPAQPEPTYRDLSVFREGEEEDVP